MKEDDADFDLPSSLCFACGFVPEKAADRSRVLRSVRPGGGRKRIQWLNILYVCEHEPCNNR